MRKLLSTVKETLVTSFPLLIVIILVLVFVQPFAYIYDYVRLAVGYVSIVVGQSLFLVGLNASILPIGEIMGSNLVKFKKLVFIIFFGLLFGFLATIAEPGLAVFARQTHLLINEVHETVFLWVMSVGIGVFVGLALWRIAKMVSIKKMFAALYILLFAMIIFVPQEFVALAFDGSGATTGDVSVPFILAMGLGVAHTFSKSKNNDDIFGIIGIASVGPILTVFVYGMILSRIHGGIPPVGVYDPGYITGNFAEILVSNIGGILLAVLPMIAIFLPLQFFLIKMPKQKLIRLMLGLLPVFLGLWVFLSGVDYGFAFAGKHIGEAFLYAARPEWFRWLLLPVSFVLGAAITMTEPAVTILGEQLQRITNKQIRPMTIRMTLAVGIGFSAVLAIAKILTQLNILWFLVPLYTMALVLMKFTPRLFVGLAFDSGGVVGGALTAALLTPLTLGIAQAVAAEAGQAAQSVLTNGFGIIAFISVTPLIAVQVLGLVAGRGRDN